MDKVTPKHLTDIGFVPILEGKNNPETRQWEKMPTGEFELKSFDPSPVIDTRISNRNARIGSMQFTVVTQADLDRFLVKIIPVYCDFI